MSEPEREPAAGRPAPAGVVPSRSLWRRIRAARWLVGGYLLVVLAMVFFENSLIFFPSVYPEGNWRPAGLNFEDAWFEASDGTRLHGWYVPADDARAVVLFAHGNGGNLSGRADIVQQLSQRLGASVLIFDYRGYGRSAGSPSQEGVLDDARGARRWLAERAGVEPAQIVLMGESLGGAVMVDLAAADGARGLILANTFSSLADVGQYHYPWLPIKLIRGHVLNSAAKIGAYHGPLVQFHGDADSIVPFALAQKLFAAANEPKQLVVIPGGDHNDPWRPQIYRAIDGFLDQLAK
jgi:uncharacterized protein